MGYTLKMMKCVNMVKAQKNSYKQVYQVDGTYHYPRLPENQLRESEKGYFKNHEITCSTEKNGKTH